MADEIERKFLTINSEWRTLGKPTRYVQGYLCRDPGRTVRIRIAGEKAYITIKGTTVGVSRPEFEYSLPLDDAEQMLKLCVKPLIDKTRYVVDHAGKRWEVDEFHGDNDGLVVAEIELTREDEPFERPAWLGCEVSHDSRYSNARLTEVPFRTWPENAADASTSQK